MDSIRTSISVDINETLDCDVTLRISDIVNFFNACDNEEKLRLRSALKLGNFATNGKTIIESMKWDLLHEAFNKYSLDELEQRLK